MKKAKILLFLLSGVSIFTACSSDDESAPISEKRPLIINVTETPMDDESSEARTATRGTIVDNLVFNQFHMCYGGDGTYDYTVTKSDRTWTADHYAPDGTNTFYAFSDGTFNWNSGDPYINFSVDENIANQKDFVVAKSAPITGNDVSLSFNHVLSAAQFEICKTPGMADYTIEVNRVELCNVVKVGDYKYGTNSWTLSSNKTKYTLNTSTFTLSSKVTALDLASGTEYLFLIPQTLTAWDKTAISESTTGCYLHLQCKISKDANYKIGNADSYGDAYLPISGELKQNTKHTITLNVGTALRNASGTKITSL